MTARAGGKVIARKRTVQRRGKAGCVRTTFSVFTAYRSNTRITLKVTNPTTRASTTRTFRLTQSAG